LGKLAEGRSAARQGTLKTLLDLPDGFPGTFRPPTDQLPMPASKSPADPTLGFLRVIELGSDLVIGGYLILNALGRPLEFHCTEPVKPNRAQQILFGATLQPYLYGEQIAQALVGHSPLKPQLLVTDQRPVLSVRSFLDVPVVWLAGEEQLTADCLALQLGTHRVALDSRFAEDREQIVTCYERLLPDWDLAEPFQRIREAITELQKAA
jgi:hypothetical protein